MREDGGGSGSDGERRIIPAGAARARHDPGAAVAQRQYAACLQHPSGHLPLLRADAGRLRGRARGACCRWRRFRGLNTFVLYFALPCMLYRFGASTPIAQLLDAPRSRLVWCARCAAGGRRRGGPAAMRASAGTTPPSARWWRPFPTPASWACRCWWRLLGRAGGRAGHHHHPDRPGGHQLAVHRAVAAGRRRRTWRGQGGEEGAARRAAQPDALVDRAGRAGLGAAAGAARAGRRSTIGLLADAASPVALFTIGAVLARSQFVAAQEEHAAACRRATSCRWR